MIHHVTCASNWWQELLDVPLYLSLHSLCSTLKCTSPSASLFRYAVVNAGYRISGSHASRLGLKTDAPMNVVWDIMRCWVCFHNIWMCVASYNLGKNCEILPSLCLFPFNAAGQSLKDGEREWWIDHIAHKLTYMIEKKQLSWPYNCSRDDLTKDTLGNNKNF